MLMIRFVPREVKGADCPYCSGTGLAFLFEPDGSALLYDEIVNGVAYPTVRCPNECLPAYVR